MKKRLVSLILIAACIALTAGCHGAKKISAYELPGSFDTSKEIGIVFWAKNDTNKAQTDIYKKAIADFEALYPNVKVTLKLYTDYSRIYNDVITNISTGTTPNVCITYPDHIATYKSGENVVVPLDDLFTDPKFGFGGSEVKFDSPKKDEIVKKFLDECIIDGLYYGMPYMRSSEACYINKTYVEAMGYTIPDKLTWDFIWEVSEAATAKNDDGTFKVNGQKVMLPFIYKSTDNMMIQTVQQKGAGYTNSASEILLFNDTTKSFLFEIADHVRSGAFSTFKYSSYPGNFMNAGQCLFAIDSTAGATWIGADAPNMEIAKENVVPFETIVMPIPQYDTAKPQMISQGPSICVFNKTDSQEVLASWLFAQYLLTNDVQIAYSQTEGYIPVTTRAQNSAEYKDYLSRAGEDNNLHYNIKINASKLLLDNIENTFITPVWNGSMSLRDAAGQLIENVLLSVKRGETVDEEYMVNLYAKVKSLYRLEG